MDVGGVDISGVAAGVFLVGCGGEGELERAVVVHCQAVVVGVFVGHGVPLEGAEQPLARHLPPHLCPCHRGTAVARGHAVERHRLPHTVHRHRVHPLLGRGERHCEVRRLVGLDVDVSVFAIPVVVRAHSETIDTVPPVGGHHKAAPATPIAVGGEAQGVFVMGVAVAKDSLQL